MIREKKYDPSFKARKQKSGKTNLWPVSRKNFLEICKLQVLEDEKAYKELYQALALSVDWSQNYRTISPYAQTLSQISFLDLQEKGLIENRLSPVLWDTQFQTAVAQADIEDRPRKGFYYDIAFRAEGLGEFVISTSRPELLPACVAVTAHPEDDRYKKFFGRQALSPLFYRRVPILPSPHADPEKGTGILMICTFGDMEDVAFCKKYQKDILQIIDEEGFLKDIRFGVKPFDSEEPNQANVHYSFLKGLRVRQAREKIVDLLKEKQCLRSTPKQYPQNVKFYEKGDFPLEILPKRQWYIKLLSHKEELLRQGRKINWHPSFMRNKYEQWVEGLNQDWCISRQRAYGVPFPLWYRMDEKGQADYGRLVLPEQIKDLTTALSRLARGEALESAQGLILSLKKDFPIDPARHSPPGFVEEQRDRPGGWTAETDVMDTWATSSISPYINSSWLLNPDRHKKLCPADLRPQSHEIIRTWAFYTMAKAYLHEKKIPWKNIAVSGWVVTSEKRKMSKSKGNILEPEHLISLYSADGLRYWAGKAGLGQDTVCDENLIKTGQRLATKIFNAGRFVTMQLGETSPCFLPSSVETGAGETGMSASLKGKSSSVEAGGYTDEKSHKSSSSVLNCLFDNLSEPIDQAWIQQLLTVKNQAVLSLQNYNHSASLEIIEKSFWSFCDNYLELVKARVYQLKDQVEGLSGKTALDYSLYTFLKLFAPYLPYVTEKVWLDRYSKENSSIHRSLFFNDGERDLNHSLLKNEDSGRSALSLDIINGKVKDWFVANRLDQSALSRGSINREAFDPTSLLQGAFYILEQVRSKKSDLKKSLASPLKKLEIKVDRNFLTEFDLYKADIARASHVSLQNIVQIEDSALKKPVVKISFY